MEKMSGPYPPTNAALGGVPTVSTDIPICAVFIVIFLLGAVAHMTIFQLNKRRGHKFLLSGMMFGFCMTRTVTMVLRIAWSTRPRNIRLALAAQIFVAAGVVLLFVINLLFAQRLLRAQHPNSGWHRNTHYTFPALVALIIITLLMLITSIIQRTYTLNSNTLRIDRDIVLYGSVFYAFISFLPIPVALLSLAIQRKVPTEKFGEGRFRYKFCILLLSATLLCLGACFRCGTNFKTPVPLPGSPAYFSKACFYIFNFTVEVIVIWFYVIVRVDLRFWIPNGSHGPGDYSRKELELAKVQSRGGGALARRIATEEEVFDGLSPRELLILRGEKEGNDEGLDSDAEKGGGVDVPATVDEVPLKVHTISSTAVV